MRVEIFASERKYELEKMINNRLRKFEDKDIVDIKYSGSGNSSTCSREEYSAMIIYK